MPGINLQPILPQFPIFKPIDAQVRRIMIEGKVEILTRIKTYPSRSSSTYRRTGNLSRAWRSEQVNEVAFNIINDMRYAVFVQGDGQMEGDDGQQEQFKVTGWVALKEVLEDEWPKMLQRIEAVLRTIQ